MKDCISYYSGRCNCSQEWYQSYCLRRYEQLIMFYSHECEVNRMKGVFAQDKSAKKASDNVDRIMREIHAEHVVNALQYAIADGAAVMFGATRDMGAVVITLMSGNDRVKVYATDTAEFEQCLNDLAESCGMPTKPPTKK